jgi:mannose-6-phosphate isomerase
VRTAALPLWATAGVDAATGGFREALTWTGEPADPRRRARVQARQAFVFATAAADGVPGPWLATARAGMKFFLANARRPDGLFAAELGLDGTQTDPTPRLYEHAFVLLALAALAAAEPQEGVWRREAHTIAEGLDRFRLAAGGYREAGPQPYQANAHMHLLEAFLAWEAVEPAPDWRKRADEVAELALSRFVDPASGALLEVFEADWSARRGPACVVEPGHQFEWAWLLDRWSAMRGEGRVGGVVRRLFEVGRMGFDPVRDVAVNGLDEGLAARDAGARLWPQTEHLKAALALGEHAAALQAANGLTAYLDTPARGVWRERMRADGAFIEEPSPATSLYHLFVAFRELERWAREA